MVPDRERIRTRDAVEFKLSQESSADHAIACNAIAPCVVKGFNEKRWNSNALGRGYGGPAAAPQDAAASPRAAAGALPPVADPAANRHRAWPGSSRRVTVRHGRDCRRLPAPWRSGHGPPGRRLAPRRRLGRDRFATIASMADSEPSLSLSPLSAATTAPWLSGHGPGQPGPPPRIDAGERGGGGGRAASFTRASTWAWAAGHVQEHTRPPARRRRKTGPNSFGRRRRAGPPPPQVLAERRKEGPRA